MPCTGFSKGASGVLGGRTSPTLLLAAGLAATGLCNIGIGASSVFYAFCAFWTLNGLLQVIRVPGGWRSAAGGAQASRAGPGSVEQSAADDLHYALWTT